MLHVHRFLFCLTFLVFSFSQYTLAIEMEPPSVMANRQLRIFIMTGGASAFAAIPFSRLSAGERVAAGLFVAANYIGSSSPPIQDRVDKVLAWARAQAIRVSRSDVEPKQLEVIERSARKILQKFRDSKRSMPVLSIYFHFDLWGPADLKYLASKLYSDSIVQAFFTPLQKIIPQLDGWEVDDLETAIRRQKRKTFLLYALLFQIDRLHSTEIADLLNGLAGAFARVVMGGILEMSSPETFSFHQSYRRIGLEEYFDLLSRRLSEKIKSSELWKVEIDRLKSRNELQKDADVRLILKSAFFLFMESGMSFKTAADRLLSAYASGEPNLGCERVLVAPSMGDDFNN